MNHGGDDLDDLDDLDEGARRWLRRFAERPTVATGVECARWLREHVPAERRREVAVTWAVRAGYAGRGVIESEQEVDQAAATLTIGADYPDCDLAFFAFAYHAIKLHSALRLGELYRFLEASALAVALGPTLRDEPVVLALRAAAGLGHPEIRSRYAVELLEQAWAHPGRTLEVVDICLAGLDYAPPFEGRDELLARYGGQAADRYPLDPAVHYHWSIGLSRTATDPTGYRAALAAIERAPLLAPRAGVEEDERRVRIAAYLQRRDAIAHQAQMARLAEEREQRLRDQDLVGAGPVSARRLAALVAAPLVAIAAALAFLAATAPDPGAGAELGLGGRVALIALLGAGLLVFTVLLLAGARLLIRRRPTGS